MFTIIARLTCAPYELQMRWRPIIYWVTMPMGWDDTTLAIQPILSTLLGDLTIAIRSLLRYNPCAHAIYFAGHFKFPAEWTTSFSAKYTYSIKENIFTIWERRKNRRWVGIAGNNLWIDVDWRFCMEIWPHATFFWRTIMLSRLPILDWLEKFTKKNKTTT